VGFDIRAGKGLGMQIVTALSKQLGGNVTALNAGPGAEFVVLVPISK
jgi:two-component sensor histidine kinase